MMSNMLNILTMALCSFFFFTLISSHIRKVNPYTTIPRDRGVCVNLSLWLRSQHQTDVMTFPFPQEQSMRTYLDEIIASAFPWVCTLLDVLALLAHRFSSP